MKPEPRAFGNGYDGKVSELDHLFADGRYCRVSNSGTDDCSIIDTHTSEEVGRIKVGKAPKRVLDCTLTLNRRQASAFILVARREKPTLEDPSETVDFVAKSSARSENSL